MPSPTPAGAAGYPPPGYPPQPYSWRPGPWQPGSEGTGAMLKGQRAWYGWQHIVVLGGSGLLVPLTVVLDAPPLLLASFGGFALGGPIIHWGHGNIGKGFASLGINFGGALAGGALGAALASGAEVGRHVEPVAVGFFFGGCAGLLAANIVDIAVLAYEEHKPESYDYIRLRLAPQVGFAPGGATFGLGGAF
ncbi:hypothetical protein [Sorangium sp. So ce131]|uniref:hypothetical protein n=1 Tax=Sorangium sp. So ce131 TaxID=3133282 RepID=UPI003F5D6CF2